jgi:uncharacterized protein YecT (DUF1311 family)
MILAFAALLLAQPAPALAPDPAGAYLPCLALADDDLRAQRDCIADEYGRRDTDYAAAYRRALARQPGPAARQRLRRLERRWRTGRDSRCAAAEAASLVIRNLERQQCLLGETVARLARLRRYRR